MPIFFIIAIILLLFSFVVFFGAPYLPTFKKQTKIAMDLLDLKQGQTLLELGCGDGRVLKYAASRGVRAIGYELNPLLVVIAKIHTYPQRKIVSVRWGNFWTVTWPPTDAIFVFLLDKYMNKLDKKVIQQCEKPVKLASFAFKIPGKQLKAEKDGVYYYEYR